MFRWSAQESEKQGRSCLVEQNPQVSLTSAKKNGAKWAARKKQANSWPKSTYEQRAGGNPQCWKAISRSRSGHSL